MAEDFTRFSWRHALKAVATGVFGTVILVLFLGQFIRNPLLAGLVPVIAAFNSAVAGFTLVKGRVVFYGAKQGTDRPHITGRLSALLVGGFSALLSLGVLALIGPEVLVGVGSEAVVVVVACLAGVICGAFGSWIATRHAELSKAEA